MILDTIHTDDYPIHFVDGFDYDDFRKLVSDYSSIHVLVDENTKKHCLPLLHSVLGDYFLIEIESGEINKNISTCQSIWKSLLDRDTDRKALLINLGGGVIGDMGGFCASTYMRGIDFVQIPTTLLSQVDASVGGKLGIDFEGVKNIVGLFNHPKQVIINTNFLKTLSPRELRSGFAEVMKHALIRDANMWEELTAIDSLEELNWNDLVKRNVAIKKEVVAIDFKEAGLRKILNYGHTIGHAIETQLLGTDSHLLHGEAIALGMILENNLAVAHSKLSSADAQKINTVIRKIYDDLPTGLTDIDAILSHMKKDKKNSNSRLMFSLLSGIGKCDFDVEVSEVEVRKVLSEF